VPNERGVGKICNIQPLRRLLSKIRHALWWAQLKHYRHYSRGSSGALWRLTYCFTGLSNMHCGCCAFPFALARLFLLIHWCCRRADNLWRQYSALLASGSKKLWPYDLFVLNSAINWEVVCKWRNTYPIFIQSLVQYLLCQIFISLHLNTTFAQQSMICKQLILCKKLILSILTRQSAQIW